MAPGTICVCIKRYKEIFIKKVPGTLFLITADYITILTLLPELFDADKKGS